MPNLNERVRQLEDRLGQQDPMRVICMDEHADPAEVMKRYRQETGYRGIVVAMDEADLAL